MIVKSINIARQGAYLYHKADPTKPFEARIEVEGEHGTVNLKLSPEMSAEIVKVIASEVAKAGQAAAEALTATCLKAMPSQKAIA